MSEKKNNRRKGLAVALAVVGVAGLSLASASQLTLNVNGSVQAGVEELSDCQVADVEVAFDAPAFAGGVFGVAGAEFSAIYAACDGVDYTFVVLDSTDAVLATGTGTISGTSIDASFTAVDAADIAKVGLSIFG